MKLGIYLGELGLDPSRNYTARDLWTHTSSTVTGTIDIASIPAHGVAMLRVSPGKQLTGLASKPGALALPFGDDHDAVIGPTVAAGRRSRSPASI